MSVEAAASAAAKQLGYGALKHLQLEIIKGIATERDVFASANWLRQEPMLLLFALSLTFCIIRQKTIVNLMIMLFLTSTKINSGFWAGISLTSNAQNCSHKKNTAEQLRTCAVY